MTTFDPKKELIKNYLKPPKDEEDEISPVGEGLAMGMMALGDAIGGASGVSTNYLGSYLKMKNARKKAAQKKGSPLETLMLLERFGKVEKTGLETKKEKEKLKANDPKGVRAMAFKSKIKKDPSFSRFEMINPDFQNQPFSELKDQWSKFKGGEVTKEDKAKVKKGTPGLSGALGIARRGETPKDLEKYTPEEQTKISQVIKTSKDDEYKKDKDFEQWLGKKDNQKSINIAKKLNIIRNSMNKALMNNVISQLGGKFNHDLDFDISDLKNRGGKVFYQNPKTGKSYEIKPIVLGGFTGQIIGTLGGPTSKKLIADNTIGGLQFGNSLQELINMRIKEAAGTAVSANEMQRILDEFASGSYASPGLLIEKLKNVFSNSREKFTDLQNRGISTYKDRAKKYFDDSSFNSFKQNQRYGKDVDNDFYQTLGATLGNRYTSGGKTFGDIVNSWNQFSQEKRDRLKERKGMSLKKILFRNFLKQR